LKSQKKIIRLVVVRAVVGVGVVRSGF